MKIFKCEECEKLIYTFDTNDYEVVNCCEKEVIRIDNISTTDPDHAITYERIGNFVKVKVFEGNHAMTNVHHLEYLILESSKKTIRHNFDDEILSEAIFLLSEKEEVLNIYTFCNIHGLKRLSL